MRYEIRDRIKTIIENDSALTGVFRVYAGEYPANINLPCVVLLPRQDSGYQLSGGNRFETDVQFDLRVYLAEIGTRLHRINDIDIVTLPDLFAEAFLSRLQLQYNDTGLNTASKGGVVRNISFQIVSDLARPIEWPIGIQGALRYWGFIGRLTIPYRQSIALKTRGT
jgi:hypothetical protein